MTKQQDLINLLIVSEQADNINFIEKALKADLPLNIHCTNNDDSICKIIENETIDLIATDDDTNTLSMHSIKSLFQEHVPIVQIIDSLSGQTTEDLRFKGADLVTPNHDAQALRSCCKVLLKNAEQQQQIETSESIVESYKTRFDDLYLGLNDPVCYLHDGIFVDCNPAFLRHFEISDKSELEELTILSFVDKKAFTDFRSLLRKATRIDLSASPVTFPMYTKQGKSVEFSLMCKPANIGEEKVVQVYMCSTKDVESGANLLFDTTTGLANKHQMGYYLQGQIKHATTDKEIGTLTYVFIKNYRDVWGADGFDEAEKFIKATVQQVRKLMPAHTEISRYTDDGLVMYAPNNKPEQIEKQLTQLIQQLDAVTPQGMKRMVEPVCYIGYEAMTAHSNYEDIISQTFRSARNAASTNASTRINKVANMEVSKKDSKRVAMIKSLIKDNQFVQQYQPIAGFSPDGVSRYQVRLGISQNEESLELSTLVNTAERYQLMQQIDQWQIQHLFNALLSLEAKKRETLRIYVPISADSLRSSSFTTWLIEQITHTGLPTKQFIFELTVDNVNNAYTGALAFSKAIKKIGGRVAIVGLSNLTEMVERVLSDISPDVLKVDIREIDTLDDNETDEIMSNITERATQLDAFIVAEQIESPAQLSKIWPYNIRFIQGDGMTPVLGGFDFNFDDFAI